MIIDAHNHVGGPDRGDGKRQTAEEIVTEMDRLGIDRAVIFPFSEINPGISFSMANNRTVEAITKYPDRLMGFARLDPNFGKKAVEELRRNVEIGLVGIKLHPSSQKFSLRSEHLKNIIKKAARLNIPIIFDSGKKEVIDGEGSFIIGGDEHNLKEGEMIIMPANVPHAVKAVIKFKMLLVMLRA